MPYVCGVDADSKMEKYSLESSHQIPRRLFLTYVYAGLCDTAWDSNAWGAEV